MAEKLAAPGARNDPNAHAELVAQVVTLTRRAAIMEAQVEVLEGKRKALARFRDAAAGYAELVTPGDGADGEGGGGPGGSPGAAADGAAMSRLLLGAQEDMRREIARAMHDGPAQSLTNIVLQAQIVERIIGGDPDAARTEVRQLIEMVEHTLEATKSFIFDVRPMVLDDLGLVPTLRRAARDRGRRAGVNVEFESLGTDRRLSMELESGLFRIVDEALAGFLSVGPERVSIRIDWEGPIVIDVVASRTPPPEAAPPEPSRKRGRDQKRELPPALAALVEEQKESERNAAEAARQAALLVLPPATWREIEVRATTLEIAVELLDGGGRVHVEAPLPAAAPTPAARGPIAAARASARRS
jgi:hypothetical protein